MNKKILEMIELLIKYEYTEEFTESLIVHIPSNHEIDKIEKTLQKEVEDNNTLSKLIKEFREQSWLHNEWADIVTDWNRTPLTHSDITVIDTHGKMIDLNPRTPLEEIKCPFGYNVEHYVEKIRKNSTKFKNTTTEEIVRRVQLEVSGENEWIV